MPCSHSIRSTSAPRIGAVRESPYIMHQIPDVFVGFHFSKSGHTAQADAVAHDPEELAVRIRLHVGGTQVGCPGVVPAKNSVQIEIVAFTEPQPVTFPDHADSTFVSARLFPGSCLSASRDSCSPTSASGLATFEPRS